MARVGVPASPAGTVFAKVPDMESEIELAVEQALGMARARRGRLVAITVGAAAPEGVAARVQRALAHHDIEGVEVRVVQGPHAMRVLSVEMARTAGSSATPGVAATAQVDTKAK